ncbi:hypothetical protein SAMN04515647_3688 [Cohaesibacter sp. ES.047]|nr:hypothetical protein SAMN04515647_3688 [Cohaesibacter sp. ES.047]
MCEAPSISKPSSFFRKAWRALLPRTWRCGAGPADPLQASWLIGRARPLVPIKHMPLADDQSKATTGLGFLLHLKNPFWLHGCGLIVTDDQHSVTRSHGEIVRGDVYV